LMDPEVYPLPMDEALETLLDRGVLRRRHAEGRPTFRFRHVLLRDAAYDSLLKVERRELHRRMVELGTGAGLSDVPDELMAWHCEQAGLPAEAARHGIRAAEACASRSAVQEADRLLIAAEEQLRACAGDPRLDDISLQYFATRGAVSIALFGKGSSQARSAYDHGVELCQVKGIRDREQWLPLYWGWWFTAPDHFAGRARAERIVGDLDEANDPEVRLQAFHCAWAANFHSGQHAECLHCIQEGLLLYDPDRAVVSRMRFGGHDAKVCGLAERALSQWLIGQTVAAHKNIEAAISWAERVDHPGSLSHALDFALMLHRYEGDPKAVAKFAERLGRLAERHDQPNARAKSKIFGGWALAYNQDLLGGLNELQRGLDLQRTTGTDEDMPVFAGMQAELLLALGRVSAAGSVLDEAIAQAERAGNVFWLAELYRARAAVRRKQDLLSGAEDLRRGLETARSQGAKALVDRIENDLAVVDHPPHDRLRVAE
jgi:predicted ATPase